MADGKCDLQMDRRKRTSESEKEWPCRMGGKQNSAGGITQAEEKEFQGPKFHKEIKINTENNLLDNTSRMLLLTLQRAAGKKWWYRSLIAMD